MQWLIEMNEPQAAGERPQQEWYDLWASLVTRYADESCDKVKYYEENFGMKLIERLVYISL